jgi:hypothetical protein
MRMLWNFLAIFFLYSCSNFGTGDDEKNGNAWIVEDESLQMDEHYEEVEVKDLDAFLTEVCSVKNVEFKNLYPLQDSIASDKYEHLILVDVFKEKGFKVANWGRGNWEFGPRIVSIEMISGQCSCFIDKLYYATGVVGKFAVTERMKCKNFGE